MLAPFRALWKQFTGSQANAIMQALWEYFRDEYDNALDYWKKFSISTATSEHLTLIGILQGLARPLIPIPDEDYLVFSDPWELEPDPLEPSHMIPNKGYPSNVGFGEVDLFPLEEHVGKFAEVKQVGQYHYLSSNVFRALLQGNAGSTGVLGSLVALDDMIYAIWKQQHPVTPPVYEFSWAKIKDNAAFPGDLVVDLGVTGDWGDPYELAAEVRLLGNTIYYPVPKVVSKITVGDGTVDPIGLIRILLATDYSDPDNRIYGLNSMWEDDGTPSDFVDNGEDPQWLMSPLTNGELAIMWGEGASWIDEEGPSDEFTYLTNDEIAEMWL